MDRLSLHADERTILGKKVKHLRKNGKLPAHVFGKNLDTEAVSVEKSDFLNIFQKVGETTLVDLKIGQKAVRPVLIREVQYNPVTGQPIHIDFYQVNLTQKVKVAVPLVLTGKQPEVVHLGEAIVLQTINEVEVEALPTDLVEKIEVDISQLKVIDDAITVGHLQFDRSKLTVQVSDEEIIVKLAPAVSAETEKLLEEQAAETAAAAQEAGTEQAAEGETPAEGEVAEAVAGEAAKVSEAPASEEKQPTRAEDASKKSEQT